MPGASSPERHVDGLTYRMGAIRECFEESGILLARRRDGGGSGSGSGNGNGELLEVEEAVRERARREIHAGKIKFKEWVGEMGGVVDTGS